MPLWQAYPRDSLNGDFTNCFAPNSRGLEAALEEASLRLERLEVYDMGGYARAVPVEDPEMERFRQLDERLEDGELDPSVPYFLDQDPSKLTITGPRRTVPAPKDRDSDT